MKTPTQISVASDVARQWGCVVIADAQRIEINLASLQGDEAHVLSHALRDAGFHQHDCQRRYTWMSAAA